MKQAGGLKWLSRLLSSSSSSKSPSLPGAVYELLQSGVPMEVQKVTGQGRGLFATRDLEYGATLFTEQPYLCVPALSKRKQVCYHCLRVLPQSHQQQLQQQQDPSAQAAVIHTRTGAFCSQSCLSAAQSQYHLLESQVNLGPLERYCEAHGERFPLLAARLALMVAQQGLLCEAEPLPAAAKAPTSGRRHLGSTSHLSSSSSSTSMARSSWISNSSNRQGGAGGAIGRLSARSSLAVSATQQDPSAPLSFLCFANVPPPPPTPWVESHKLLARALLEACDCREDPQEGQALAAAVDSLDIDWYVAVLARLHLNTFKVDAVFPMDLWDNPYAAAAAMLQADSSSGSALYLLASLFNHSCEPCVNVTFPSSDGTAVFAAARRISAGEQLFISYTDTEQEVDVRQEYLAFAYGFRCNCDKCRDDVAELRKGTPLQH